MRTIILILLVALAHMGKLSADTAQSTQPTPYVSIMWKQYHLIEIAMMEVKKVKFDLAGHRVNFNVEKHRIGVGEMEKSFLVVFSDPNRRPTPPGVIAWGNQGIMPAFEVEINKADLKVIRANFIK